MFKFIAWHKAYKLVYAVAQLNWCKNIIDEIQLYGEIGAILDVFANEVELLQWTGWTDKNGQDIYEGHILYFDHGGGVESYIVERNEHDKQLCLRLLYFPGYNTESLDGVHNCLIIGHKFTDPELLESNNEC